MLGNAQIPEKFFPIVYCSDGFCELTGICRGQVMRKSCSIKFLWGEKTTNKVRDGINNALREQVEYRLELCKRDVDL